jgi:hypothetical protein
VSGCCEEYGTVSEIAEKQAQCIWKVAAMATAIRPQLLASTSRRTIGFPFRKVALSSFRLQHALMNIDTIHKGLYPANTMHQNHNFDMFLSSSESGIIDQWSMTLPSVKRTP